VDPLRSDMPGTVWQLNPPAFGDGRAILLGEVVGSKAGCVATVQLKGSAHAVFAWWRRACLAGAVLREYGCQRARCTLLASQTRSWQRCKAERRVFANRPAVRCDTPSPQAHCAWVRFKVFCPSGRDSKLRRLTDYAYSVPTIRKPMVFGIGLRAVCAAQADLIAAWMSVGLYPRGHGTRTIAPSRAKATIYGPCALWTHSTSHPCSARSTPQGAIA